MAQISMMIGEPDQDRHTKQTASGMTGDRDGLEMTIVI